MSKKFANKIAAERLVLASVNQFTSGVNQLSGLTIISIVSWVASNGMGNDNSIELLLRELSEKCHRMTDRSQEAFESTDEIHLNEIKEKIPELQDFMREYFDQ